MTTCLRRILLAVVCLRSAQAADLTLAGRIDLPDISGDVDHMALDTAGERLFLAAEDNATLRVIDLKALKLQRTVKGFETPHSILFLPDSKELLLTDGSKAVHILDSQTFVEKRAIPTTPGADSIGVDRKRHLLYTVTGGKDVHMTSSKISVIDFAAGKLTKEIPIEAAHVEAMALEQAGPRLFVNVTDKNYLAVIDRSTGTILQKWNIAEARQNAPLAFDEPNKRLFVVCRDPGKLVVVNSESGASVANFPTGARADEVVFDARHRRIYVASGEGKIYPYQQSGADHYTALTPVPSAVGAKTALLSADAGTLYLAVSPGEGKTGSQVLVYKLQ